MADENLTAEIQIKTNSELAKKQLKAVEQQLLEVQKAMKLVEKEKLSDKLIKDSQKVGQVLNKWGNELKAVKKETRLLGKTGKAALTEKMKMQLEVLNNERRIALQTAKTKTQIEAVNKAYQEQVKAVRRLTAAKIRASKKEVAPKAATGKVSALTGVMKKLGPAIVVANQAFELIRSTITTVIHAVDGMTRAFREFETALIGVAKTSNLSDVAVAKLGVTFQNMSLKIPVAAKELARIGELAGQLGVRGSANITLFAETVARVVRSTDLSAEQAALQLTRVLNVTREGVGQVDRFASVLVRLGNNAKAAESEILDMANEIARSTTIFRVSSADAAAIGTALREMGVQSEIAGSTIQQAFNQINDAIRNGGKELLVLQDLTGMTRDQLRQAFDKDATQVFKKFVEGLSKIDPKKVTAALEQFGLKGLRVNKVIGPLSQNFEGLAKNLRLARDELKENSALTEESDRAFSTFQSSVDKLQNAIDVAFIQIGKAMREHGGQEAIEVLADAFARFAVFVQAWAPPILATLRMVFMALTTPAVGIIKMFASLAKSMSPVLIILQRFLEIVRFLIAGLVRTVRVLQDAGRALVEFILKPIRQIRDSIRALSNELGNFLNRFEFFKKAGKALTDANKKLGEFAFQKGKLFEDDKSDDFVRFLEDATLSAEDLKDMLEKLQMPEVPAGDLAGGGFDTGQFDAAGEKIEDVLSRLQDRTRDLQAELEGIGTNQIQQLEITRKGEVQKLMLMKLQLQEKGLLAGAEGEINKQINLVNQIKALKVAELRRDAVEDLEDANKAIMKQTRLIGKKGKALETERLKIELEMVDAKMQELKDAGLLTEEAKEQLRIQKELLRARSKARSDAQKDKDKKKDKEEEGAGVLDVLGEGMDIVSSLMNSMFSLFNDASENFALNLAQTNDMLLKGMEQLPEFAMALVDSGVELIDQMIARAPEVIDKMVEQLPVMIDKLSDVFIRLVDALPGIVDKLSDALPGIVAKIFDRLPDIIEAILDAVPMIVASIMENIPMIITNILDRLPEIVEKLISGLIGAMSEIVVAFVDTFIVKGGAVRIAIALVKAIVKLIPAIVKGFADGLKRAFNAFWNGFEFPAQSADKLINRMEKGVRKVVTSVTGVAEQAFAVIDLPTGGKEAKAMTEAGKEVEEVMVSAGMKVKSLWQSFLDALKKLWMWVWDKILEPIVKLVEKAWKWVWNKVIKPIVKIVQIAWKTVLAFFKNFKNTVAAAWAGVMALFENFGQTIAIAWRTVVALFKNLGRIVSLAFAAVINFFKAYKATVEDAFRGVIAFWKNFRVTVDDAWKSTLQFFRNFGGLIAEAWDETILFFKLLFKGHVAEAFQGLFNWAAGFPQQMLEAFQPILDFYDRTFARWIAWFDEHFVGFFERTFGRFMTWFNESVTPIFMAIIDGFKIAFEGIRQVFMQVVEAYRIMFNTAKNILTGVMNGYKIVFDGAGKILQTAAKMWQNGFDMIMAGLREVFGWVFKGFQAVGAGIKAVFGPILRGLNAWFQNVRKVFDFVARVLRKAMSSMRPMFTMFQRAVSSLASAFRSVIRPFEKLAKALRNPGSIGGIGGGGKKGGGSIIPTSTGEAKKRLGFGLAGAEAARPSIQAVQREVVDQDIDINVPFAAFNNKHAKAAIRPIFDQAAERLKEITGAQRIVADTLQGMKEVIAEVRRFDANVAAKNQGILTFGTEFATGFRNLREERAMEDIPVFQDGGFTGPGGLARVHPGEFVLRQSAVQGIGLSTAEFINQAGRIPRQPAASRTQNVTVVFEPGSIAMQGVQDPDRFVDELVEVMRRRGIDGDFVMSASGLRETS